MKTINPFLQAIEVKYIGPSNTRGSRYKATSASGLSITVHADDSLNPEENAYRAAKMLQTKYNWKGDIIGGHTQKGYVFVQVL